MVRACTPLRDSIKPDCLSHVKSLESQRIQVIRMLFLVRKGAVLERGLHPFALCGCTACLPGLNLSHHFLKLFFCRQVDHSDGGEVNINLNMPLAINFL